MIRIMIKKKVTQLQLTHKLIILLLNEVLECWKCLPSSFRNNLWHVPAFLHGSVCCVAITDVIGTHRLRLSSKVFRQQ
jgi:hypothetical protein